MQTTHTCTLPSTTDSSTSTSSGSDPPQKQPAQQADEGGAHPIPDWPVSALDAAVLQGLIDLLLPGYGARWVLGCEMLSVHLCLVDASFAFLCHRRRSQAIECLLALLSPF